MPSELDLHYPPEACPFCGIAAAFPAPAPSSSSSQVSHPASPSRTPASSEGRTSRNAQLHLASCVPSEGPASDPSKTTPSSFIILASRDVLAFLDILPMTRGHVLVATRGHRVKVEDLAGGEGESVGFWLPVLARVVKKVTGSSDYNIVQNNGARAAQVVPHVHFHIIPRPETMPELKSKSWTMFGRGQRDELDDDEGAALAAEMRRVLREEVEKMNKASKL